MKSQTIRDLDMNSESYSWTSALNMIITILSSMIGNKKVSKDDTAANNLLQALKRLASKSP